MVVLSHSPWWVENRMTKVKGIYLLRCLDDLEWTERCCNESGCVSSGDVWAIWWWLFWFRRV